MIFARNERKTAAVKDTKFATEDISMRRTIRLLSLLFLALSLLVPCALADSAADEHYAASLFLSNFTETGVKSIPTYPEDIDYVDFAHDHLWFNDADSFEYSDYGENNCRVSDRRIQEIIDKYFYDAPAVDLSQTRFDYIDGYYYHCETGGWISDGFAYVLDIYPVGDDVYYLPFFVYGGGYAYDNSVLNDSQEEIEAQFGHANGYGCALVHAEDPADRSTYRLISYSRV